MNNNLKKMMILSIFTIVISFVFNKNSVADDCCDNPDENPCYQSQDCDSVWYMDSISVFLDGHPNCQIFVKYCRRTCEPEGDTISHATQWSICKIAFIPQSCNGCDVIFDEIFPGGIFDNDAWSIFKYDLVRAVTYELFEQHLALLQSDNREELVNCDDGNHAKYTWIQSSCSQKCFVTESDGTSYITELPCTDYYCCGLEILYCYDEVNDEIITKEKRFGDVDVCYMWPAPIYDEDDCPDGADVSITSSCEDNCIFEEE